MMGAATSQTIISSAHSALSHDAPSVMELDDFSSTTRLIANPVDAPVILVGDFPSHSNPFRSFGASIKMAMSTAKDTYSSGDFVRTTTGSLCRLQEVKNKSKEWALFRCDWVRRKGVDGREHQFAMIAVEAELVKRGIWGRMERWIWETKQDLIC
jgi:hypothetical protein